MKFVSQSWIKMSKVGFGTYRVSHRSKNHKEALINALELGVDLIETSPNYTGGDSEKLIGEVLKEHPRLTPFIISKVGYLEETDKTSAKKFSEDLVQLGEKAFHSIHPDFIEDQLLKTLKTLGVEKLDGYLLHNPEVYFTTSDATQIEYLKRIALAFEKLESLVERGFISHYGVSSNNLILDRSNPEVTDLDTLTTLALKISDNHHFKFIQFPLNLIETGALERYYEGANLIERAREYGLTTMTNRPLNAFTEHGLLRLASLEVDESYGDELRANEVFNDKIKDLVVKWIEVREDEEDKLFDLPIMKQISSIWHKQASRDAVDQIFQGYFFPLVAKVYGRNLEPIESQPFYELYDYAIECARFNMNERSKKFEDQAIGKGLLFESDKTLSQKVVEKYQQFGADYILVGMRDKSYVEDLKEFF